ncbi:glycosyltransferase, partial [Chloroflexota bacterium]
MKIVHLLPYYAPAWGFGGVVRAVYGLTTALAAQGHEVVVVTTDANDQDAPPLVAEERMDGVRVLRCRNMVPSLRHFNLSSPVGLRSVLQTILQDAAVLHVHEFRTVENLVALPLARQLGIPVVLSPHGTLTVDTGRSFVKRGWDRLWGRWSAKQVNHVVGLTADEVAEACLLWSRLGLALTAAQISVVPNGVNPADFTTLPSRHVFREQWGVPADAPVILFLGRLHERKGVHHLIDALVVLPDVWLAVVGPDEGQESALRAQAGRLGVAERIIFTGLLTGNAKLAALSGADLLALPAVGEGLPMVALEAMAAGLPVALSAGCHLPEAVAAGAGVRLQPLTGPALAASLAPLLADQQLRQSMGRAGQRLVAEQFAWVVIASQMVAGYEL